MKKIFIIAIFLSCVTYLSAQCPPYFKAIDSLIYISAIKPYFDKGFIGITDNTLFKLDTSGNITSARKFLPMQNGQMILNTLNVNADSSVVLLGYLNYGSGLQATNDFLIIKLNKFDSITFCKTVRDTSISNHSEEGIRILATDNNALLIMGNSFFPPITSRSGLTLLKLDSIGNLIWSYKYNIGGGAYMEFKDGIELPNKDIFILAIHRSPPYGDIEVAKISAAGNLIFSRNTQMPNSGYDGKILALADSSIYYLGAGRLYCFNTNGSLNWEKHYLGNIYVINDMVRTPAGDFFAAGTSIRHFSYYSDENYFLSHLDFMGKPLWAKNYGRTPTEQGEHITSNNSQLLIWGEAKKDCNSAQYTLGLMQTDTNGTAPCIFNTDSLSYEEELIHTPYSESVTRTSWMTPQDYLISYQDIVIPTSDLCSLPDDTCIIFVGIDENHLVAEVSLYPNPASTELNITISPAMLGAQLNIYDVTGCILQKTQLKIQNTQLDIQDLSSGVYMAQITTEQGIIVKRWVKM